VGRNNNTIQALWVGIGSFSSFALTLVSAAILSRYFDKTEYGTYRQILYVYNTLLVIFTAGLPRVFSYFLPRYNLSQGKDIVWKITKVLFLGGLTFSVFLFAFSGLIANILKNPELSRGLKYFSPIPMLLLPTLGIEGIFSTYKKAIYIAIYNTLSRILMLLFIVLPVIFLKGTYIQAIYGWIIVSIITLFIAYLFKGIPFKGVNLEKSNLHFKEILIYSLPIMSASIAGIAYRAANQFYISRYFGPVVFAEFSNGFIEIPFVSMITGATSTVLMPIFSKIIHDKSDITQLTDLWRSALQKSAILIYPIVIFCLFYSNKIVIIVYSDAYSGSSKFFSTAMILNFFNIIIFSPLLLSLGKARFYARLHFGLAITTWFVEYLVIIFFKTPIAVAISFVIIAICLAIIAFGYSSKIMGVRFLSLFPIVRLLVIAIHSFISLFIVDQLIRNPLSDISNILYIIIAGVGYLGILLISAKWFKINYWEILMPLFSNKNTNR
jgi:O-antigen/teichoic acid export membrane protein